MESPTIENGWRHRRHSRRKTATRSRDPSVAWEQSHLSASLRHSGTAQISEKKKVELETPVHEPSSLDTRPSWGDPVEIGLILCTVYGCRQSSRRTVSFAWMRSLKAPPNRSVTKTPSSLANSVMLRLSLHREPADVQTRFRSDTPELGNFLQQDVGMISRRCTKICNLSMYS